jgi:hypothetical protein
MKTKEEILETTHSFMDDTLGRCYERVEVESSMDEYASQFQQDSDLRAKEAVEKFARECYEIMKVQSMTFNVLPAFEKYCKENGVNL